MSHPPGTVNDVNPDPATPATDDVLATGEAASALPDVPAHWKRNVGLFLSGQTISLFGSMIVRAPVKKPLAGFSSSLKSPTRIFSVGTVMIAV